MKLYQVQVPCADNAGQGYNHIPFRNELVERFGGFTSFHANGAWKDDKTGHIFADTQVVYQIATDDEDKIRRLIEGRGMDHYFPGQEAWFWAEIGGAWIV